MVGGKALLVIGGGAPKIVATGESYQGVKVVSTTGDTAVLNIAGKQQTLRVGESPVSVGQHQVNHAGDKITISMASGGHFLTQGSINGAAVQFMVDTGAPTVAMGASEAKRMGLDYTAGQPVRMNTANGQAMGYLLKLNSVRIGSVEVNNVDAIVSPQPMSYVLLGNSFLTRFSMRRDSDVMVLERRY